MPEPMTAPMPSPVSDQGPRVFFSRCSGSSDSEISLSMDLHAKSWFARVTLRGGIGFLDSNRNSGTRASQRRFHHRDTETQRIENHFHFLGVSAVELPASLLPLSWDGLRGVHWPGKPGVLLRWCSCHPSRPASQPSTFWSRARPPTEQAGRGRHPVWRSEFPVLRA